MLYLVIAFIVAAATYNLIRGSHHSLVQRTILIVGTGLLWPLAIVTIIWITMRE